MKDLFRTTESIQGAIGYCPQTNPILSHYTVKEALEFFAKIKGLPENQVEKFGEEYANKFMLQKAYKDNTLGTNLSGGNKRKLCTAIAMMGHPDAIFLDESSAGVDPFSRRRLWTSIRNEGKNSALIVTTHSMEEAQALGSKMAIMVDGQFKCYGTLQ